MCHMSKAHRQLPVDPASAAPETQGNRAGWAAGRDLPAGSLSILSATLHTPRCFQTTGSLKRRSQ